MISHIIDKPKSWILAHGEFQLNPEEIQKLQEQFRKYLQDVPLPYLLGEWEFYGRRFRITPDVLIPRPETELLVDLALSIGIKKEFLSIVDVGTGSGIIAISLAAALSKADIYATDLSMAALKIAKQNAYVHSQKQIKFLQSNLLAPFKANFDLICANLPYIPSKNLGTLRVAKWEPRLALDGGESGLDLIEKLLIQAKTNLAYRGTILLEIESSLGEKSLEIAKKIFPGSKLQIHLDLSGKDRVLQIQVP